MKPIRIQFSAFGSYPGTVDVDFTSLASRGLFVVTGDTGTGKTTIFDAMSYALFGQMPSKDGNDIRSHHADPSTETWARFTFEIDGTRYEADRSPAYDRPKSRGAGFTTQQAKASLNRIDASGTTNLTTKSREMDRIVADLVGLDDAQFRRVMLLPQGEVARFLLDNSKDREELLSQLFGGQVYEHIIKKLADRSKELTNEVGSADEDLRHHLANAISSCRRLFEHLALETPDDLDDRQRHELDELATVVEAPTNALATESRAANEAADAANRDHLEAKESARRFDRANELNNEIATLTAAEPAAIKAAEAAQRSQRARGVTAAAAALEQASEAHRRSTEQADAALDDLTGRAAVVGLTIESTTAADIARAISTERASIERSRAALSEAETARATRDEAAANHNANREQASLIAGEVERLGAEVASIDEHIAAVSAEKIDLDALDAEHSSLTEALTLIEQRDDLRRDLDTLRSNAVSSAADFERCLARYVATEAPRLAAQLVNGEPCPVCGSIDHPQPASDDGGESVDIDAVNAAQHQRDLDAERAAEADQELGRLLTKLGDLAESAPDVIEVEIAENRRRHGAAATAAEAIAQSEARRHILTEQLEQHRADHNRLEGAAPELERALIAAGATLAAATAAIEGIDDSALDRHSATLDEIDNLAALLDQLRTAVTTTEADRRSAEASLATALAESEFDSADEAAAALIDHESERSAIDALEVLQRELGDAVRERERLVAEGIPTERPDPDALAGAAASARSTAEELSRRLTLLTSDREQFDDALAAYDQVGADSASLRSQAEAAKRAVAVCSGNVGSRISLRRWVLGRELEHVTAVASEHLASMTAGRYRIQRVREGAGRQGPKGLDLEVLDAHTGRARRPNSLSGGEQFQASLALALGLADVVSQGAAGSGHRIGALFIDEGFGSLDPRSLDDAIETLHQLQATGRMVGAITHVEAMKERLHPGIVVSRLPDGRGSTLRVNP